MPKLDGLTLAERAEQLDRDFVLSAYRAGVGTTRIAWYLCRRDGVDATSKAVRHLLCCHGVELRSQSEAAKMRWKREKHEQIRAQNT